MTKAKKLMWDDTSYKKSKKFQFEHVWSILKDAEKWMGSSGTVSAQPRRRKNSLEGGQSSSHTSKSSGTPSFNVDLNVDVDADEQEFINEELSSSYRPIGTKKAKHKRKEENEKKKLAEQILEENRRLKELVEKNMSDRCAFSAKHEQYAATKLEIQRQREENKIMLMSLDSISDPKDREYFEMRKNEIRQRRARESQQQQSPMTFGYDNFANMNPFQGDTQATFNSGSFGNALQVSSQYGSSGEYGATPNYGGISDYGGMSLYEGPFGYGKGKNYGGSGGTGTSDGHGGAP